MAQGIKGRCIGGPYPGHPLETVSGSTAEFSCRDHKGQYIWHDEEEAYVWYGTGQNQPVYQGE